MGAASLWSKEPDFKLKPDIIDIWLCRGYDVQDRLDDFNALLSVEEQTRAQRFKFEIHQNRFIISHGFQRSVLAQYLEIAPARIRYQLGDKGKPSLLETDYNSRDLRFNLSHTKDITLLAITSGAEVGIDIEHIDRKTDWQAIGQRFFTKPEQQALFSLSSENQQAAFYQLWTRKEAYMKVLGSGLSLPPTGFTLTVPPQPPALIQHHSTKIQTALQVEFIDIELLDELSDYCAALAAGLLICEFRYFQYVK